MLFSKTHNKYWLIKAQIKQLLAFGCVFLSVNSNAQKASVYTKNTKINVGTSSVVVIPGNVSVNGPSYIVNNNKVYIAGNFVNNGNLYSTGGNGETHFNGTSVLSGSAPYTPFYDLYIDAGNSLSVGASAINITAGGSVNKNNTGTFDAGTGSITFLGKGTIGGSPTTFYRVILNDTLTLLRVPTIKDTLRLNSGSVIKSANNILLPTYTNTSTLSYNYLNESFTTGKEWYKGGNAVTDAGLAVPQNVFVQSGTITIAASGGDANRTLAGNLIINTGATFNLSTTSGNDLFVLGNWTNNGSFTANSRTVQFNSSATQNILGTTGTTFYDVKKANNNTLVLNLNTTIANDISIPAGILDLNSNNLAVGGAFSGQGRLTGSDKSSLTLYNNVDHGKVFFTQTIPYNQLSNLSVNAGTLTLGGTSANGDTLNIVTGNPADGYGTVVVNGILNTNNILTLRSGNNGTAMVAPSTGAINGNVTVERYIPARRAWRFLTVPFSSSSQTINDAWQEGKTNTSLDCGANQFDVAGYGTQITYNGTNGYDLNTTVNPSIKVWANTAWTTPASTKVPKITDYKAYCLFVRGDRTVCLSNGVNAPATNTILRSTGVLNEPGINNNDVVKAFTGNAGETVFAGNPYAAPIDLYNVFSNAANNSSGIVDGKFAVWDPAIGGAYGVGGYVTITGTTIVPNGGTSTYPDAATAAKVQSGEGFFVYIKSSNTTGSANFTFRESNKIASQFNVFSFTGNSNAASRSFAPAAKKPNRNPKVYINLMLPSQDSMTLLDGTAAVFDSTFSAGIDDYDASKKFNFNENIGLRRDGKSLAIETRPLPTGWDTLYVRTWLMKAQNYTLQTRPENIPPAVKEAWLVDNYLNTKYELKTTDTSDYNFTANSDTNSYAGRFMIVFRTERRQQQAIAATNNGSNAKTTNALGKVSVSPNPVTRNEDAVLRLNNISKGIYEVEMFNTDGRKVMTRTIEYAGGYSSYPLKLNQAWAAGKYNIALVNKQTGETVTLPLIIVK